MPPTKDKETLKEHEKDCDCCRVTNPKDKELKKEISKILNSIGVCDCVDDYTCVTCKAILKALSSAKVQIEELKRYIKIENKHRQEDRDYILDLQHQQQRDDIFKEIDKEFNTTMHKFGKLMVEYKIPCGVDSKLLVPFMRFHGWLRKQKTQRR